MIRVSDTAVQALGSVADSAVDHPSTDPKGARFLSPGYQPMAASACGRLANALRAGQRRTVVPLSLPHLAPVSGGIWGRASSMPRPQQWLQEGGV